MGAIHSKGGFFAKLFLRKCERTGKDELRTVISKDPRAYLRDLRITFTARSSAYHISAVIAVKGKCKG